MEGFVIREGELPVCECVCVCMCMCGVCDICVHMWYACDCVYV